MYLDWDPGTGHGDAAAARSGGAVGGAVERAPLEAQRGAGGSVPPAGQPTLASRVTHDAAVPAAASPIPWPALGAPDGNRCGTNGSACSAATVGGRPQAEPAAQRHHHHPLQQLAPLSTLAAQQAEAQSGQQPQQSHQQQSPQGAAAHCSTCPAAAWQLAAGSSALGAPLSPSHGRQLAPQARCPGQSELALLWPGQQLAAATGAPVARRQTRWPSQPAQAHPQAVDLPQLPQLAGGSLERAMSDGALELLFLEAEAMTGTLVASQHNAGLFVDVPEPAPRAGAAQSWPGAAGGSVGAWAHAGVAAPRGGAAGLPPGFVAADAGTTNMRCSHDSSCSTTSHHEALGLAHPWAQPACAGVHGGLPGGLGPSRLSSTSSPGPVGPAARASAPGRTSGAAPPAARKLTLKPLGSRQTAGVPSGGLARSSTAAAQPSAFAVAAGTQAHGSAMQPVAPGSTALQVGSPRAAAQAAKAADSSPRGMPAAAQRPAAAAARQAPGLERKPVKRRGAGAGWRGVQHARLRRRSMQVCLEWGSVCASMRVSRVEE